MFAKFGNAILLLGSNVLLFSAIIFTIRLPANVVVNYLAYRENVDELTVIRASMFMEGVFGPIYIGALIVALDRILRGERPDYGESIAAGFRNWGRLFGARLAAGILCGLGLIAFIIPGIVLMVRYALLDPAVVLEGADSTSSRRRSAELTAGVRWEIFVAALLFFFLFVPFAFVIYIPLALFPPADTMAISVFIDCVIDLVFAVIQIVMFLYYWEQSRTEDGDDEGELEPKPAAAEATDHREADSEFVS